MKDTIQTTRGIQGRVKTFHPVRLTALLYLKEALLQERYEDCLDLVLTARDFGASELDIDTLIEDPRRDVI